MSRARRTRHGRAARRTGYLVTAGVDVAMIYALLVWPGWEAVPFLTSATTEVLGLLTLSFVAGVALNLLYVAHDPPWLRSLGDAVTAGIGLVVLIRVWQVFPFDFGPASIDWALAVRALLVVAMLGTAIGILVGLLGGASALSRLTPSTPGWQRRARDAPAPGRVGPRASGRR